MKQPWSGALAGVQPRIDLGRSFDQRFHNYLGYLLVVEGEMSGAPRSFTVRIGPGTQAKHAFRAGDRVAGLAEGVLQADREVADLYKASSLRLESRSSVEPSLDGPPWRPLPPLLDVYRARGHRRLDPRTYEAICRTCTWGCRMPVTMIIDQWNPGVVRRRFETFCYGPKSCSAYRAGALRRVPGRNGMSYVEEAFVDDEATAGRGPDE